MIEIITGSISELPLVQPLWEGLRDYHCELLGPFSDQAFKLSFDKRQAELIEKSKNGHLRIDIARDTETDSYVGYCISTVNASAEGEIDSLFIDPAYRKQGIGDMLMRAAIEWLDSHNVTSKRITVGCGNEIALPFYERYGFLPRAYVLSYIDKK